MAIRQKFVLHLSETVCEETCYETEVVIITDSEWQWYQMDHMQICTLTQTQPRQHPTTWFFYRPYALPAAPPTALKH